MTRIPFTKMAGTGNDFIIVDARRRNLQALVGPWRTISRALCDRHTGIGADGLLLLKPSRRADVRMRVFNADGSEAEMCGNGVRCVALFLTGPQAAGRTVRLQTKAGLITARVRRNQVAVRMTEPTGIRLNVRVGLGGRSVRLGCINTGVPHVVVSVPRLEAVDVERLGRTLRHHRAFAPKGTNVNFIQPDPRSPDRLLVRTYERGVEGETLACGTGIAASAIVYAMSRRPDRGANGSGRQTLKVEPRSGDTLTVSFAARRRGRRVDVADVVMEGEATRVFNGTVDWPLRRP